MAKRAAHRANSRGTIGSANEGAALENAWKRRWPDDPSRPVLCALQRTYLKRLTTMVAHSTKGTASAGPVQELKKIGQWLYEPASSRLDIRDPRAHMFALIGDAVRVSAGPPHLGEILANAGVQQKLATTIIRMLSEPLQQRGAPIKPGTRRLAITALEAKLEAKRLHHKFSWQGFANKHCRGEESERVRCRERIRQVVLELRRLLGRLGCKEV